MDSDPDIEFIESIEKDSGMSSLGGSKDETPERKAIIVRSSISLMHLQWSTFYAFCKLWHFDKVTYFVKFHLQEDIDDEEVHVEVVKVEMEHTENYDDVSIDLSVS